MLRFNLIRSELTANIAGLPFSGPAPSVPANERSRYAPMSDQGRR
jgi:hypothetical protein